MVALRSRPSRRGRKGDHLPPRSARRQGRPYGAPDPRRHPPQRPLPRRPLCASAPLWLPGSVASVLLWFQCERRTHGDARAPTSSRSVSSVVPTRATRITPPRIQRQGALCVLCGSTPQRRATICRLAPLAGKVAPTALTSSRRAVRGAATNASLADEGRSRLEMPFRRRTPTRRCELPRARARGRPRVCARQGGRWRRCRASSKQPDAADVHPGRPKPRHGHEHRSKANRRVPHDWGTRRKGGAQGEGGSWEGGRVGRVELDPLFRDRMTALAIRPYRRGMSPMCFFGARKISAKGRLRAVNVNYRTRTDPPTVT